MKPLIVANWKMNPEILKRAKLLFDSIKRGIKNIKNVEIVISPPFIYLPLLLTPKPSIPKLGAQDCFWEEKGAFTGEISAKMLKNLGCDYVILGHSERRRYFRETDDTINKKIRAALKTRLKPILCIGETFEERKKGKTFQVLRMQLEKDLKDIFQFKVYSLKFIVAYEPVWTIGTGKPCPIKEARIELLAIRKIISHLYDSSLAKKIKIIYGGSVNRKIAKDYIKEAQFQGLLIGGASLNAKEFIEIVKEVSQI